MTPRYPLPLLLVAASTVAAADLPTLPTLSGELHIRYRRVRRSYPKPVPRAGLAKTPFKEEENVVKDLYLASWGTTVRTKDVSNKTADPLLKTEGRRPDSRTENRPDRLVVYNGLSVVVKEESHNSWVFRDLPLLGVNTPYARAVAEPPQAEIWKMFDGKDDPSTRCGVPMPSGGDETAYTSWPGHYVVRDGRLVEHSVVTPDDPVVLRTFERYAPFEGVPIARRIVLTSFTNESRGTRAQRPISEETIQTIELIERGVGSLPTWASEIRPGVPVVHRKGDAYLESSVYGDGKVEIPDGAPKPGGSEPRKDDRTAPGRTAPGRTGHGGAAFGAGASALLAAGLAGTGLRKRR